MKTEFLIVCKPALQRDELNGILTQSFDLAYGEHIESYGDDGISLATENAEDMISVTILRKVLTADGEALLKNIYGFELETGVEFEGFSDKEISDTLIYLEDIIRRFAEILREEDEILHVVKFYDDVLLEQNLSLMREVFAAEMKLRQVISLIYLAAQRSGFYNLLEKDNIKIPKSAPNDERIYAEHSENEFYYLTFGQYAALNNRREVTTQKELIEVVSQVRDFEELRARLLENPINEEKDADLLASLRELMTRIEDFRNCVAHNRKVTTELSQFYSVSRPVFDENLDDFLKDFLIA